MKRREAHEYRRKIEHAAQYQPDADALESIELFPLWKPDTHYEKDERVRYEDKLWRIMQAHTAQAHQPPSIDTASLYTEVTLASAGETADYPIPYNGNMELHSGKYYAQDGVTYICTRDSGAPLYNPLAELVGIYAEMI